MSNKEAGEHTLTVDDKDYTLRLDFRAIAAIEDRLGEGVLKAVNRIFQEGEYRLSELGLILEESLRSGGAKRITFEGAGDLMMKAGLLPTAIAIRELLDTTFEAPPGKPKAPRRKKAK